MQLNHRFRSAFTVERIEIPYDMFPVIYYQSSFEGKASSFPSGSENVFFGRGANPPKRPQNSPASASAINFPSSVERVNYNSGKKDFVQFRPFVQT